MDDQDLEEDSPNIRGLSEFECPECNAHNPYPDGFAIGGEVICFYCGMSFKVTWTGSKLKLKSL